jgi:hypothetical protein
VVRIRGAVTVRLVEDHAVVAGVNNPADARERLGLDDGDAEE